MPETPKSTPKSESLSLAEMMRIMDVATEMRTQRETVEKEFAVDETRRILREKLLQTTAITGERVTEAEVDAAIESYFSTLYTYREPKGTLSVVLAQFYVKRGHLAIVSLLALTLLGTGWWSMKFANSRFSSTARTNRKVAHLETAIQSNLARVQAVAREPALNEDLARWQEEAQVAGKQLDLPALGSIEQRLGELATRLNEVYQVRILADTDQQSGFVRNFEDAAGKRPAYYLIVSAINERGEAVRRTIESSETRKKVTVDRWAEQVPKEVFDRIKEDKKADGILNETSFSLKRRGFRDEEILLQGADEKPITRLGQITEW